MGESEFVTISYWESVEAISRFAGDDPRHIHHLERDAEFLVVVEDAATFLRTFDTLAAECRRLLAGRDAFDAAAVGTLLSSAPGRLLPAVQNLQTAEAALKQRLAAMQNALSEALAQAAVPGQPAVLHCDGADGDGLERTKDQP